MSLCALKMQLQSDPLKGLPQQVRQGQDEPQCGPARQGSEGQAPSQKKELESRGKTMHHSCTCIRLEVN